jgi:multidrug efflux pump subunit AcrA (membrane-fusion protein)
VAALASAKAELVRARRNLERTYIRVPYDGMVRSKETDLGQYVNTGSRLGIVFATDEAEIRLPLTDNDLAFINLPKASEISATGDGVGPRVTLTAVQRGKSTTWEGRIVRSEGVVDEKTRVTYAVARIDDPYQLSGTNNGVTPLPMGTFVAATIEGMSVRDVLRIPRSALRGNGQIIIVDDDNLVQIRNVEILRADADYAYLLGGAIEGERLCLTAIESPINGMRVRTGNEVEDQSLAASSTGG